jgi:hypothetical protein
VARQECGVCHSLGFGDYYIMGRLQTLVQSALLSPSRAGGKGTKVFGFGSRRDDGDRVCCKVSATVVLWHVPHF